MNRTLKLEISVHETLSSEKPSKYQVYNFSLALQNKDHKTFSSINSEFYDSSL